MGFGHSALGISHSLVIGGALVIGAWSDLGGTDTVLADFAPFLGVMKFETEPLTFENWRRLAWMGLSWLQDAGGFAMVGLVLWVLNGLMNPVNEVGPDGKKRNRLVGPGMLLAGAAALTLYLVALGLTILVADEPPTKDRVMFLGGPFTQMGRALELTLAAAGLVAIIGFAGPFVRDCFRMRWGRIY